MKRILVAALASIVVLSAGAQKVVSRSRIAFEVKEPKEKVHYPLNFFVKVGGGVNIYHAPDWFSDEINPIGAFNVALGLQKQLNKYGLYFGAQLGISNSEALVSKYKYWYESGYYYYDYCVLEEHCAEGKGVAMIYGGFLFGIKKPLNSTLSFDGHIGGSYFVSLGKYKEFESNKYVNGEFTNYTYATTLANGPVWELGLGIWIKKFLVEIEYRGLYNVNPFTWYSHVNTALMLNVGYQF